MTAEASLGVLRVNVIATLQEEGWLSMDLVADMLMAHLGLNGTPVSASLLRPTFPSRVPTPEFAGRQPLKTAERIAHRFWTYPRWLRQQEPADVYHIVDHSYAHLARVLPAGRVVTMCHDTDAFRTLMFPEQRESSLPRLLVKRVLDGLQCASIVVCGTDAVRMDLVTNGVVPRERTTVIPNGVHPSCSAAPDPEADAAAAILTGPTGRADLLHVGSTIPRKRIDVLLKSVAEVAVQRPDVRLWRVGGPFTADQEALVRRLGLDGRIHVLPLVSRPVLAALYRRAGLVLLPSDREGFGLPVIEAMACGTPIVVSDLPVLREVGGAEAEYCRPGDSRQWASRILTLLQERDSDPASWAKRQSDGLAHASRFSWKAHASAMEDVYLEVADRPAGDSVAAGFSRPGRS